MNKAELLAAQLVEDMPYYGDDPRRAGGPEDPMRQAPVKVPWSDYDYSGPTRKSEAPAYDPEELIGQEDAAAFKSGQEEDKIGEIMARIMKAFMDSRIQKGMPEEEAAATWESQKTHFEKLLREDPQTRRQFGLSSSPPQAPQAAPKAPAAPAATAPQAPKLPKQDRWNLSFESVSPMVLASYLLEANVMNVADLKRELQRLAAYAILPQAKKWVMTVGKNYLMNLEGDELEKEYSPVTGKPPKKGHTSLVPSELPDWATRDIGQKRAIHFFNYAQPTRRSFWRDLSRIVQWFNGTLSADDPSVNRLDRVSFEQARDQANAWYEEIHMCPKCKGTGKSGDKECYVCRGEGRAPLVRVKDRPTVVMEMPNGYKWVELTTEAHFKREGNLMNHCVATSHGYGDHYYSLRDADNVPHVTVEVSGKTPGEMVTRQVKGNSNRKPDREYQPYIKPFLKKMGIRLEGNRDYVD